MHFFVLVTMENICFSSVVVVCCEVKRHCGKLIDILGARVVLNEDLSFAWLEGMPLRT